MNKTILNPKQAEELQNKIYQKMSAEKKLKIASQLFLLGKKLHQLKSQKSHDTRRLSLKNRKAPREA